MDKDKLARNFPNVLRTVPSEMMMMYGRNVIRKRITVETEPMLAVEKNVDAM